MSLLKLNQKQNHYTKIKILLIMMMILLKKSKNLLKQLKKIVR